MLTAEITIREARFVRRPQLYFVKHDKEPRKTSRPEVFRLEPHHFYDLTEAWQWFWFDALMWSRFEGMTDRTQLSESQFDELAKAFSSLTAHNRAFTNGHGTDKSGNGPGINYVTGENVDNPIAEIPAAATLICGGTVLTGEERYSYLHVETLDGSSTPPSIRECNPGSHPWYFTAATIVTTAKYLGKPKVIPFPQLQDGAYTVYVPIASKRNKSPMRYRLSALTRLSAASEIPNPYWPPRT